MQEDRVQKIKRVVHEQRRLYADDPNVHSIGWGQPRRAGELADEVAILFCVREKVPDTGAVRALGSRYVPEQIEGFPTDVDVDTLLRSGSSATGERDEKIWDPLVGGVASANAAEHLWVWGGYGTLGMLCRDVSGSAMAMSNWHVWADGGKEGDNIIQPGHPTAGDHVLSVAETLACGPILGAVLNTQVPSPLTAGLYGGAAAVGILAGLSDRIDPTRRGQEATPVVAGELTHYEEVEVELEFPDLPWPGTPFRVRPRWTYSRHTDRQVHFHEVAEEKINPHFLIGHAVFADQKWYAPTDPITIRAVLWDHHNRPCDGYHVCIHLIPDRDPTRAMRRVLRPTVCSVRDLEWLYPTSGQLCMDFRSLQPRDTRAVSRQFDWLSVTDRACGDVRIDNAPGGGPPVLVLPPDGVRLRLPPSTRVEARILNGNQPVKLRAYDPYGTEVGEATTSGSPGAQEDLTLDGPLISTAELLPSGRQASALLVCSTPIANDNFHTVPICAEIGGLLRDEGSAVTCTTLDTGEDVCFLRIQRCCFERTFELPSLEQAGHWTGYLTVQNINDVARGTDPVVAARTIGGNVVTPSAQIVGCAVLNAIDVEYDSG